MTTSSKKRWQRFRFLADAFERRLIVPTIRMAWLASAGAVLVAAGYAAGYGTAALLLVNGALLGASVLDVSLLPRRRSVSVSRSLPEQADIGMPFEVTVHAEASRPVDLILELADDLPQQFIAPAEPLKVAWRGKTAAIRYMTAGCERGEYRLRFLRLRFRGTMGLWMKQMRVPLEQDVKIYPDLSGVRGILASMQNHLVLEGKRIYRKERAGSEFHSIREYVPDDDPRFVNWRASARTGTLMANVFRPERGKVITILIDCGRMMGIELDGRTKLDVSLEAALSLAAVALKQGDKVGLLAFSSRVKAYVPPGAGLLHLQAMTEAVYDLKSDFVESSYGTALQYLMLVQKKRSLTVLFSDMDNYMFEEGLKPLLMRLKRQHHLLLLGLRDEALHRWTLAETKSASDAFVKSLSHKFALDRQAYTAEMAAGGIEVIDVPVGELAWTAVNRYLDVKEKDVL
ncbi:hypothetical protein PAE9249_01767 [Paenibacillus sp. CECT 9249]|uniref:DUF58 domain-containing protein n=1 Tax=Paenibacillus sp. CECT 9249 TaxID=2845385 RepID=UPI001E4B7367|nr:DUF58 domain-containing protein [Paenibacillus sp. CECT 9249]CAH0119268.1 hypothetical protein PAE9249_01767 [Paenibacillus sp. CECT 9249]